MPLAESGGRNVWVEFDGASRSNFVDGFTSALLSAGWKMTEKVKASITHTYTSISDGTTVSLGGIIYTWKATLVQTTSYQVKLGASINESLNNLAEALARKTGMAVKYSNTTLPNPLVRATVVGAVLTVQSKFKGPLGSGTATSFGVLIGGGYRITGSSSQVKFSDHTSPLQVSLYVRDDQVVDVFTNKYVSIQMYTSSDPTNVTALKKLNVKAGRKFRVVANRCQFFCYVPGLASDALGSVLCGGVPFVPPSTECGGEVPVLPIDEIWWASCDQGAAEKTTPRVVVAGQIHVAPAPDGAGEIPNTKSYSDAGGWNNSEGCVNGVINDGSANHGAFRLLSLTPPNHYDFLGSELATSTALVSSILIVGEKALRVEPMIAWATHDPGDDPLIQAQLYDAWIETQPYDEDAVVNFSSKQWLCFTNQFKFGTLQLLVPALTPTILDEVNTGFGFSH